jgi:hypothetical protein
VYSQAVATEAPSSATLSNQSAETLIELDVLIAERKYDHRVVAFVEQWWFNSYD